MLGIQAPEGLIFFDPCCLAFDGLRVFLLHRTCVLFHLNHVCVASFCDLHRVKFSLDAATLCALRGLCVKDGSYLKVFLVAPLFSIERVGGAGRWS